jgi:hypothetical protein
MKQAWGGSVRLDFDFRGRTEYVNHARALVAELCNAELAGSDTSNWIIAAQELLENLAKYAAPGRTSFEFELGTRDDRRCARLVTRNEASPERLDVASALLGRITESADPVALYDSLVAESGEEGRSRLGLIRIRAEAGLDLAYTVHGTSLEIVVSGSVPRARENA